MKLKKGRGSLHNVYDHVVDGERMSVAKDFLTRLVPLVIEKTCAFRDVYCKEYDEINYPLRYNERGLSAVFLSAVSTITDVYLSEIPVLRKTNSARKVLPKATDRRASYRGRMDCWARYRGLDFCLELKQGNLFAEKRPLRAGKSPRKALQTSWETLSTQVKEAKKHAEKENKSPTVGIGICVVPCFEYAPQRDKLESEASQIFEKLLDDICPKPLWAVAWEPPKGRIVVETSDNNGRPTFEGVAAVSFLCHIVA
jgi:hypothetical protein